MEFIYKDKSYPCSKYKPVPISKGGSFWSNFQKKKISTVIPMEVYKDILKSNISKRTIFTISHTDYENLEVVIDRATITSKFKNDKVGVNFIINVFKITELSKAEVRSIKLSNIMS